MAILKRRSPRPALAKIRQGLWPSMGWGRTLRYYRHRVFRTGDSTYKITAGLASGMAVSFSPFIGTHVGQGLALAWLLRASLLASFVGTALGNPATYPLIFWAAYKLGVWLCAPFGLEGAMGLPADMGWERFGHEPAAFLKYLFANPMKLLLPLTAGGYALALLSWPVSYALLYYPVRLVRAAYHRRRKKKENHGGQAL